MEDYTWETFYPHVNNEETMREYIDEHTILDIVHVDGTYAEGVNTKGEKYAIHASGNGDFHHHRIRFELLKQD